MIYVGDLVQYIHPLTASNVIGIVTDMMEMEDGWPMYEVICTDPPDRGWYSDLSLIDAKKPWPNLTSETKGECVFGE